MPKKTDEQLLQINNLRWLPWIGKNYSASQTKLMVLGESHYLCTGDSHDGYSIDFTRSFIGMHQSGEEGTNVIRNGEVPDCVALESVGTPLGEYGIAFFGLAFPA